MGFPKGIPQPFEGRRPPTFPQGIFIDIKIENIVKTTIRAFAIYRNPHLKPFSFLIFNGSLMNLMHSNEGFMIPDICFSLLQ